jgi:hypothetical protein
MIYTVTVFIEFKQLFDKNNPIINPKNIERMYLIYNL